MFKRRPRYFAGSHGSSQAAAIRSATLSSQWSRMPSAFRCSTVVARYSSLRPDWPTLPATTFAASSTERLPAYWPVGPVDDVAERGDGFAGRQPDRQQALQIDLGDELALAQIGDGLVAQLARHPEGEPDAGAAMVEAEHQPRPLLGAAMHPGIDAQRAAEAVEPGARGLDMGKARPPDQRAVAKHPKIAHIAQPSHFCAARFPGKALEHDHVQAGR